MTYYKVFCPNGRFMRWVDSETVAQIWAISVSGYYVAEDLGGPEWMPTEEEKMWEGKTDGPDLAEHFDSHSRCSVAASIVGSTESPCERRPGRMIAYHSRACALLKEALDWIGVVNLTEREEKLAYDLQKRIARLLAEVREWSE